MSCLCSLRCALFAVLTVLSSLCSPHCALLTVLTLHCAHSSLCLHMTVLTVLTVLSSLCSLLTVLSPHCALSSLCTLFAQSNSLTAISLLWSYQDANRSRIPPTRHNWAKMRSRPHTVCGYADRRVYGGKQRLLQSPHKQSLLPDMMR